MEVKVQRGATTSENTKMIFIKHKVKLDANTANSLARARAQIIKLFPVYMFVDILRETACDKQFKTAQYLHKLFLFIVKTSCNLCETDQWCHVQPRHTAFRCCNHGNIIQNVCTAEDHSAINI